MARIAVIGVGNEFRRDDGVGPAVIAGLERRAAHRPLPAETRLSSSEGDPGRLIGLWDGAELAVVVDAAHVPGGRPGRVHRLESGGPEVWRPSGAASTHGFGLGEAVELSRALGRTPRHLVVYAVECADTALGRGLTPAVSAAVDPLVERIAQELARHRGAAEHARHPDPVSGHTGYPGPVAEHARRPGPVGERPAPHAPEPGHRGGRPLPAAVETAGERR
ncbi:hydrogenase maturation protease [Streptomyces palmae]|uniref:hydrogenase maturation protease n=1 Tax=Streptomyces palmae TaxID=1701085 RepID=UPI003158BD8C